MNERRNDLEKMHGLRSTCLATCFAIQARIDLLFTMSEIPHAHPEGQRVQSDVSRTIQIKHSVN
jgi:hypothetical protein